MTALPDFRSSSKPDDYVKWVRFKLSVIVSLYKHYFARPTVGGRIDAFAITPFCRQQ
jgi:hypothetical protein